MSPILRRTILNVHKGMEEYVEAKANILRYQSAAQKVILNYDNDLTRAFSQRAPGKTVFSAAFPRTQAMCFADGRISVRMGTAYGRCFLLMRLLFRVCITLKIIWLPWLRWMAWYLMR